MYLCTNNLCSSETDNILMQIIYAQCYQYDMVGSE